MEVDVSTRPHMESVDVYGAQRSWYSSYKSKIARSGPGVHWAADGNATATSPANPVNGNEDVFVTDDVPVDCHGQHCVIRLVILKA
jgi:hypothetical protein